jgi:transposase
VRFRPACPCAGRGQRRDPISKQDSRYLRWALFEAALHACNHPVHADRYQAKKKRLGRQRGPKVAQIDLSRKLAEAIWHMLTRNQPFAPADARFRALRSVRW